MLGIVSKLRDYCQVVHTVKKSYHDWPHCEIQDEFFNRVSIKGIFYAWAAQLEKLDVNLEECFALLTIFQLN